MVASPQQNYLKEVVGPHKATLASLWVASLRDFASIKGDSEVFQDGGSAVVDSPYAGLGREVLLPVRIQIPLCNSIQALTTCSTTKIRGQGYYMP